MELSIVVLTSFPMRIFFSGKTSGKVEVETLCWRLYYSDWR